MGCWNHTCALTNLPISYGDDVYVFLLEEAPWKGAPSYCYPSAFWNLLPVHFEGKYDDYGGVEECNGLLLPTLLEAIKRRLIEMPQGENQYHDIAVTKEGFTVEKLFEADHGGRLFVQGMGEWDEAKPQLRLKHIVFHKRAVGWLLEHYEHDSFIDGKRTFKDFLADGKGYANYIKNLKDEGIKGVMMLGYPRIDRGEPGDWFSGFVSRGRYEGHNNLTINSQELVMDALWMREKKEKGANKFLDEVVFHIALQSWLDMFMMGCRRVWVAPSGSGSQDTETNAQRTLAATILETAEWLDRRYDDDEE